MAKRGCVPPLLPRPTRHSTPIMFACTTEDKTGYTFAAEGQGMRGGWSWFRTEADVSWCGLAGGPLPGQAVAQQHHHIGNGVRLAMRCAWMLRVHTHVFKRPTLVAMAMAMAKVLSLPWAGAVLLASRATQRGEALRQEFAFSK